jgi:hypothetical protein
VSRRFYQLRTAAFPPRETEEIQMQKAHLYEAILLVNRGIDDAVRGLERLKRAKDSGLNPAYFDEKFTLFETHRALLNSYFCNNVEGVELQDEARFAKRHREHEKRMLDEVQVYQDVKAVEENRLIEGRAPKVRFLSFEEQQGWERQYPRPPVDVRDEPQQRKGEKE